MWARHVLIASPTRCPGTDSAAAVYNTHFILLMQSLRLRHQYVPCVVTSHPVALSRVVFSSPRCFVSPVSLSLCLHHVESTKTQASYFPIFFVAKLIMFVHPVIQVIPRWTLNIPDKYFANPAFQTREKFEFLINVYLSNSVEHSAY